MLGSTRNEMRYLYAIFTLDENNKIDGVYVGSADEIGRRVRGHMSTKKGETENTRVLHEKMRADAYAVRPLNSVTYEERWQEYDWIRFFRDYTNLRIYNTLIDCYPDESMNESMNESEEKE